MAGITWLHLSDWHQKGKDFDREVVRDALIKDIREREKISPDLAKIDFIIFSGDAAFSGKKEEYEAAREHFFKPVLEATGLTAERLFIVPGNHDLDRDAFDLLPDLIRKPFEDNQKVNEWLTDNKKRDRLGEPFEAYRQFVTQYTHQIQPDYSSIRRLWIDGKRVALLGLNSALMAGRKNERGEVNDDGKLIIGEPQLYDALHKIASDEIRIAVLHHPLELLAEFERDLITQRLQDNDGCHFILCGHQHKAKAYQVTGTTGNCVIIPAGSSYSNRAYHNGYNFVHLNFATRKGTVYLRIWDDDDNYWREHIAKSHEHGYIIFEIPKKEIRNINIPNIGILPDEIQNTLKQHFDWLIPKIKNGLVIPFLGADINLCDRSQDPNFAPKPWEWNLNSDYPPTSVELAAYLDRSHKYLQRIRCPLCDEENLPSNCPIMTQFVTRLDLQNVSQYFNLLSEGEENIKETIAAITKKEYKPNRLHQFLAELPRFMDEMGYSARIKTLGDKTRYQLIVTTNFDRTLEQAFVNAKQPFDLVSYTAGGEDSEGQIVKQFVHQRFEHEIEGDNNSAVVQKGQIKPIPPGTANEYSDFSLNERPVILKLYGPVDLPERPRKSFAITEDHFIDYLAYADNKPVDLLPSYLLGKLNNNHIWFLGYSLRYWHQRVILHRLLPEKEKRKTQTWWAVHPKPDALDKFLWKNKDVALMSEISLEIYFDELNKKLKKQ